MKKTYLVCAAFLLSVGAALYAADEVRSIPVNNFEALSVGGGIKLVLLQDASPTLRVSGPASSLDRLDIKASGKKLSIGFKPFSAFSTGQVTAQVTIPKLSALELSGGSRGELRFDARSSNSLSIELTGGATISGTLIADKLIVEASGGSAFRMEGYAEDLGYEGSGGSRLDSPDFALGKANIEASGGCYVLIAVQNELNVEASGGSTILYRGNPKLKSSVSGGSSVRHQE